jgi:hypothetical protein
MGFAGHFVSWVLGPGVKLRLVYMGWAVFSRTAKTSQAAYRPLSVSSISPFSFQEKKKSDMSSDSHQFTYLKVMVD